MIVGRRILGCKVLNPPRFSNISTMAMMPLRRMLATDASAFTSFRDRCAVAFGYLEGLTTNRFVYTRNLLVEAHNLGLAFEKSEEENAKLKDALAKLKDALANAEMRREQSQRDADAASEDNTDDALTEAEWQNLVAESDAVRCYTLKSVLEMYIKVLYGRNTEYAAGLEHLIDACVRKDDATGKLLLTNRARKKLNSLEKHEDVDGICEALCDLPSSGMDLEDQAAPKKFYVKGLWCGGKLPGRAARGVLLAVAQDLLVRAGRMHLAGPPITYIDVKRGRTTRRTTHDGQVTLYWQE